MKTFYGFVVERGWVERSPLARLRAPRSDSLPTMPLTVVEMRALLDATTRQPKERALLLLMRYSGLAIADAVTLCREALVGTELTLRRAKSGELVMVDLPHLVVKAVNRAARAEPGPLLVVGQEPGGDHREVLAQAAARGGRPHGGSRGSTRAGCGTRSRSGC